MQLANAKADMHGQSEGVRPAVRSDAAALQRLLRDGAFVHVHVDWHLPGDWLGEPGFVVHLGHGQRGARNGSVSDQLQGCLAITADPLPAAWVRVAAVRPNDGFPLLDDMLRLAVDSVDPAVEQIAWFLSDRWPESWLEKLGFAPVIDVITFEKQDMSVAAYQAPLDLAIRPVRMEDFPALAAIEEVAFEPIWRHSADGLLLAWRQSLVFDVAVLDGRLVGFQFCTRTHNGAHLARMTVHPEAQGRGIGAALLAEAIELFRAKNLKRISLNTQRDNVASQKLYRRFGFVESGQSYAVWSRPR